MEFGLSEEQRLLQSSVVSYLESASPLEHVREVAQSSQPHSKTLWQGFTDLGIPGIIIPEFGGGVDLGCLDAALVAEALGAVTAPVPFIGTAVMAPVALLRAGSEEQQEQWLPQIAGGECIAGICVTEQIGRRESNGLVFADGHLSGKAMFAFDGIQADLLVVAADDNALYLVDGADPGVSRSELTTIDRTRSVAEIVFDKAMAEPLPGSIGNPKPLAQVVDVGRIMLAADTLGAAQTMLNKAIDYAGERRQFNRVIGSFQAVKHMCAEMAAELEPCRSLVWYAAHSVLSIPQDSHSMACHAKAHLSEVGRFVARTSTEVHGGMGITDLLGLHYWFKRIGLNRQLLGTPELVREEAAVAQGWA